MDSDEEFEDIEEGQEEEEEEIEDDSLEGLTTEPAIRRTKSYDVLTEQGVRDKTGKLVKEVQEVCNIPRVAAILMMQSFNWNKDRLLDSYLENAEATCKKALGVGTAELKTSQLLKGQLNCLVCLESVPASKTMSLSCKHLYCTDCWKDYLELQISQGPKCVSTRCMFPKCPCLVPEDFFQKMVKPEAFSKYKDFLDRSFVDKNPLVKWCPAPGCKNAVQSDQENRTRPVVCACGFAWCFICSDFEIGDHSPVTCKDLEKWRQKASDESESIKYIKAHTKLCPKCRSPIEKNEGCMHMTCSQCRYEFCWLCRGDWKEHGETTGGYYKCNKYDQSTAKSEDDSVNNLKTELETYLFYFHRYESHRASLKIAWKQRQECHERQMKLMQIFGCRNQDVMFLSEATEQLIQNRRVLQYSYTMGYYLDKSKSAEKNLFEYLQEKLEKNTNTLSEYYEQQIENKTYQEFFAWKEKVCNYTRVTNKFLSNFLEGVANGLTSTDMM